MMAILIVIILDHIYIEKKDPTLELIGKLEITKCPEAEYEEEGYKAMDSRSNDISNKVKKEVTSESITYTVTDRFKKTTTKSRKIINVDEEKPVLNLNNPQLQTINNIANYIEYGVNVTDNCDPKIAEKVKITNNIEKNNEVIYEVTDTTGNYNKITRKVVLVKPVENHGKIYLTFDDGPSEAVTPKVLDILKHYNIKATFFVTGSGLDYLIKRAYDEGHEIALHTYTHNYQKLYSSIDNYFNDLNMISDRVYKITNHRSKIIRFPGGGSNTISRKYQKGIMTKLAKMVKEQGYLYYDWNISSQDAERSTNQTVIYSSVVNNLRINHDNMVLMHDTKSDTAAVLSRIIEYGITHNYEFSKITPNTKEVHHKVNN